MEFNYKNIIKEKNKRIRRILDICDRKDKEIERLKEELKYTIPIVEHNKTITKHIKEKEQLHSIIKEVREYIETINKNREGLSVTEYHNKFYELYDYYESGAIMQDVLEILGGENNEDN